MNAALVALASLAALAPTASTEPDRGTMPAPGAEPTWQAPTPQRVSFLGVDGYLVERHDVPIVELSLGWNVGDVRDPKGKEGMHGLCVDLLDESTRTLDKSALEDRKADLGASIATGAGRETARLHVRVTRQHLPAALDLVAQLLLEPGLRADDLERLRAQYKAAVLQERASAESVAGRVLSPILWGASHPYGQVVTEQSLDAITAADCAAVAAKLKPAGAQLVAVGDVTGKDLAALFSERLSSWQGRAPGRPRIGAGKSAPGSIFFVDVPGAAQSRIVVAHLGSERTAADYWPTTVMTQILGSGMSSRLMQNLREKNGYTYGARAGFNYGRAASSFTVSSSVRTDVTVPALREVLAELRGMTTRPPTDDEVNRERLGGIRALPSRFGTGASTLGSVWEILAYDLALDTWARMPTDVRAVTTDGVRRAVTDRLKSEGLVVVVAGDAATVLPELQKLADEKAFGPGGLVQVDGDARVVKR